MSDTYLTYWEARQEIMDALKNNDDERIKQLAKLFPDMYRNLSEQAANALKKMKK